jgi:FkbM family methyltransferase
MSNSAKALLNSAMAVRDKGDRAKAEQLFRQALAIAPDYARAHNNLGELLSERGEFEEAEAHLRRAVELDPGYFLAWNNLGILLSRRKSRLAEARDAYERALSANPDHVASLFNYATLLSSMGETAAAVAMFERTLAVSPNHLKTLLALHHQKKKACDWADYDTHHDRLLSLIRSNAAPPFTPFALLSTWSTLEDQHKSAVKFARTKEVPSSRRCPSRRPAGERPIRIGYLSRDYYHHATSALIVELFEKHDRSRFQIHGYCYSPDDGSALRQRVVSAFDRFVVVRNMSDEEAAQTIAADEIDILVDLKGYTKNTRSKILAYRPAPIQVNFLGYPGTMGGDFVDYILADPTVAPFEHQPFYSERIVHLPHCYQPNDAQRAIAPAPSRAECGLPEGRFVFCCFNNTYKLNPTMFDVWMRILRVMPYSVLWLFEGKSSVAMNLRREAELRGVSGDRLIFAPPKPMAEHIARFQAADLFLDTLPYNAHTTASEAIWAGLPVLTCEGSTFAGRVCASILNAAGAPELITRSLAEYESRALALAQDRDALAAIRRRLEQTRTSMPLFRTEAFAAGIEDAYASMWRIWAEGGPARQITASDAEIGDRTFRRPNAGDGPGRIGAPAKVREGDGSPADPLFALLAPSRPTAVVDIGANPIGGKSPYRAILDKGLCTVTGFEPQEAALAELQSRKGPRETYLPYLVADGERHRLRVCHAPGMTSLLEPDPEGLALFQRFPRFGDVVNELDVETKRLDDIAEIDDLDFLTMDVQGAELMVLRSGRRSLARALAVQAEVSFMPLYKRQPTFGEIDAELRGQGFVPHCFARIKRWPISAYAEPAAPIQPLNQLLEADIVYVRAFSRPNLLDAEQWKHLAIIAHHAYRSYDLAHHAVRMLVCTGALPEDAAERYLMLLPRRT